jgi:hypothetical protein
MQMLWIPTGTVVTAFIGIAGYLGKRYLERRRETEVLALLIQAANLRMKLRQSGATLQDLRALQREALSLHQQPQETSAASLDRLKTGGRRDCFIPPFLQKSSSISFFKAIDMHGTRAYY